jgi:hypothetical protein
VIIAKVVQLSHKIFQKFHLVRSYGSYVTLLLPPVEDNCLKIDASFEPEGVLFHTNKKTGQDQFSVYSPYPTKIENIREYMICQRRMQLS